MAKKYITFLYNKTRCHALIVEKLLGGEELIGEMDGYRIYEIDKHALFDQYGFVATKI